MQIRSDGSGFRTVENHFFLPTPVFNRVYQSDLEFVASVEHTVKNTRHDLHRLIVKS